MLDEARLIARLKIEEGRRKAVYKDSLGYWTIGDGILVDARRGGGLLDDEMDYITANRVKRYYAEIQGQPWMVAVSDDDIRTLALTDMYYQLRHHLFGFVRTLSFITVKDFASAGKCLRKSLWARQTPNRAIPLIEMIETGEWRDPR